MAPVTTTTTALVAQLPSFDRWAALHGKSYASEAERHHRRIIFEGTAAGVAAANSAQQKGGKGGFQQGMTWHGLDRTEEELKRLRGYNAPVALPSLAEAASFTTTMGLGELFDATSDGRGARSVADLPASFDWRAHGAVSEVKEQGQGSSCWSFSSAGAVEGAVAIARSPNGTTGNAVSVSNQQIMDCSKIDCLDAINGTMTKAFANVIGWGGTLDSFKDYPYRDWECVTWDARCNPSMIDPRCKFWCPPHVCQTNHTAVAKISKFVHTSIGNETDLLLAVSRGPVAVAMDASQSNFMAYTGGVYSNAACQSDKADLDHAVLAVGWGVDASSGEEYWLVKNSWGTTWGMDGYFHLKRNSNNMCGIATDASMPFV